MKMKIPEIKAELELRGVPFDGLFEKEEFAEALSQVTLIRRRRPEPDGQIQ